MDVFLAGGAEPVASTCSILGRICENGTHAHGAGFHGRTQVKDKKTFGLRRMRLTDAYEASSNGTLAQVLGLRTKGLIAQGAFDANSLSGFAVFVS